MRKTVFLALLLLVPPAAFALNADATRDEVIAELGKPTSIAMKEGHEILMYPHNVRIEMADGRILSVKGLKLNDSANAQAASEPAAAAEPPEAKKNFIQLNRAGEEPVVVQAPSKPAPVAAPQPAPAQTQPAAPVATPRPAQAAPVVQPNPAESAQAKAFDEQRKKMEGLIEKEEGDHDKPPSPTVAATATVFGYAVGFGLRWVFMLVVIWAASKFWTSEISFGGMALIAAVDGVVRILLTLAAIKFLKISTLFGIDDGICTLVLIPVIRKVSYNHSIVKAVEIALTTKLFARFLGELLIGAALMALSGLR